MVANVEEDLDSIDENSESDLKIEQNQSEDKNI